jgi:spore coat polysaccharide biosynthesis protein SpsF
MNIGLFVQARMGSTRLPGKVMLPVLGKPLLSYLIERLKKVTLVNSFTILTTELKEDDVIEAFCKEEAVNYYRGPSQNVLERFYNARNDFDAIVRITGDCPLIDPKIIDEVIKVYKDSAVSYVSNALERTYPRGMDVEIFSKEALEKAYHKAYTVSEKEHVTLYIYCHPEEFKLKNVALSQNLSSYRLTVDTKEDFELISKVLEKLYPIKPDFDLDDIINFLKKNPELLKINAHIEQKPV